MELTNELGSKTLLSDANSSWFNGTNVPGKKRAMPMHADKLPSYRGMLQTELDDGLPNFTQRKQADSV